MSTKDEHAIPEGMEPVEHPQGAVLVEECVVPAENDLVPVPDRGQTRAFSAAEESAYAVTEPKEESKDADNSNGEPVREPAPETDSEPDPEDEAFKIPKAYNVSEHPENTCDDTHGTQEPLVNYPVDYPTLYALRSFLETAVESLKAIAPDSIPNNEQTRKWRETLSGSLQNNIHPSAGAFDEASKRDAEWTSAPVYETRKLSPGRTNAKADGGYYRGNAAVAKVAGVTGLGQSVTYPLWATGLWLTVKAPSNARLGELERQLVMNKDALGYTTKGMVFANDAAYAMELLVNHILEDVADCTLENWDIDTLKAVILAPDLQTLALAYANSIYTNGFPYSVPCTIDPKRCTHVTTEKLHLGKLLRVDRKRLTETQLKHMSLRSVKHSVQALAAYQEQHQLSKVGSIKLNDQLSVVFGVPTIRDYIDTAHRWIDGIERLTEKAFGREFIGAQRQDYMKEQLILSLARQYSHWVKELVITEDENGEPVQRVIDARDDVDESVGFLTADEDLTNTLIEAIGKYIADRTISFAAINNFACPNCKHWHHTSLPNRLLLPVDAVSTFFTLMQFKLLNFTPRI